MNDYSYFKRKIKTVYFCFFSAHEALINNKPNAGLLRKFRLGHSNETVSCLSELILAKDPMDKVFFLKRDLLFDFLVRNLCFLRRDDKFVFDVVVSLKDS
jgi:hypothetical protein